VSCEQQKSGKRPKEGAVVAEWDELNDEVKKKDKDEYKSAKGVICHAAAYHHPIRLQCHTQIISIIPINLQLYPASCPPIHTVPDSNIREQPAPLQSIPFYPAWTQEWIHSSLTRSGARDGN